MRFITVGLFLLLFSTNNIHAQHNAYLLTGAIMDKSSNQPLFYVNTGLLNAEDSTVVSVVTTDKEGFFTFSNIKSGNYIIKTAYLGYDIFELPVSVSGEDKEIKLAPILLQPAAAKLEGITVATSKPVYMNDGEKILYNVSEDVSIQTGTVADALQNAPGVEVDIEGNITLRGVSNVEIWINDKPSRLDAENLKTYLQQLPANSLERIEVINNPSARYSAKGTGGIINIVTKSNIQRNSFISFGLNGSTRPMLSPWFSYMFSNEKFSINFYLNGYYYFSRNKSNGYSMIFTENMDTSSYRSYTSDYKSNAISTGSYLYGSYNIDSLKTISFYGGVWGQPFGKSTSSKDYQYHEYIDAPGIYDYVENSSETTPYINTWVGIEYEHNFNDEGHKLVTELSGSYWQNKNLAYLKRSYSYFPERDKDKKVSNYNKGSNVSMNINYSLPYIKDGMIEIGFSSDYWPEMMEKRIDTLSHLFSGIYFLDSMRYEDFKSHEADFDAYFTIEHKFGNFKIKGGLRSDNRLIQYKVINQPEHHDKKIYAGLYPSLHLSYSTKTMHNFNLSYTRRVNYPWAIHINTFIVYDEDSYSTGNKELKSTYTNSVEGGWTKYFTKFGSLGLKAYFKNNKNERNYNFVDVIYSEFFGHNVSFSSYLNSGKSHQYGGDVNVMYKLKAFMNITFNAGVYQYHSETIFREDETVITNNFYYNFQLNFWAKLWKFLEVNASGYYRSKTRTVYSESAPTYAINCGLRSDFWDKKISVFLNVQDIFNWGKQQRNNTNPYYIAYSSTKYNSRFISAGITFRFGKIELEKQARTGGNTE
ncbi:MAG: TonB-dependent receptor family protein [Lentimicrobiaceae bacterium]|nr:TonB-dependent receptor family protein [Lentimicrobiaceae bacterium]